MSAAMLFAQPWRAPADFFTEQHDLGRRPGQLEASTAAARALFDATGQRQILLDRLPAVTAPTLVIWGGCDYVLPAHQAQSAVGLLPHDWRCSPTADICPTSSTPTASRPYLRPGAGVAAIGGKWPAPGPGHPHPRPLLSWVDRALLTALSQLLPVDLRQLKSRPSLNHASCCPGAHGLANRSTSPSPTRAVGAAR